MDCQERSLEKIEREFVELKRLRLANEIIGEAAFTSSFLDVFLTSTKNSANSVLEVAGSNPVL